MWHFVIQITKKDHVPDVYVYFDSKIHEDILIFLFIKTSKTSFEWKQSSRIFFTKYLGTKRGRII